MTDVQKKWWGAAWRGFLNDLFKPQTLIFLLFALWSGVKTSYYTINYGIAMADTIHLTARSERDQRYKLDTFILSQQVINRQIAFKIEQLRSRCGIDWSIDTPPSVDHCTVPRNELVFTEPKERMTLK